MRAKLVNLFSPGSGSQFRRNFLSMARANVIALALPLLATPILTRLYEPDSFGRLAIFSSILSVATSFCTWRFDWSLPNTRTRAMAGCLFLAGATVLAVICAGLYFLLLTGIAGFLGWNPLADLGKLALFLPVALLAGGLNALLSGWFVRQGDLSQVGRATIARSIANVSISTASGLAGSGAVGLIAATTISSWFGIVAQARHAGHELWTSLAQVTKKGLATAIAKHGRNATWSTMVSLFNAVSFSAPLLLLAHFYSTQQVGWYALMFRLLAAPIGVLSSALAQSFWSLAAELARNRGYSELRERYRNTTVRLGIATIPVMLVCLCGPYIIGPIFGVEHWQGAGDVLRAMAPMFIGTIMFSSTSHLTIFDKQSLQLFADIIRLILIILSIFAGFELDLDFSTTVLLTSLSSLAGHIILFYTHIRTQNKYV
ncbi:lipopolysaccharide biosynthesis protein [Mesorhizobium sp. SP-1A]|uniref:lipopolysaccharide biosynthesis protein n=1 Tax=Mesorhizobium sp. SP-1A TaxID=3077840 RepID=UPI0028F6E205|nr:oligosaccharide flippase family protein [Mesorhizobium sp. SP-1A]